MISRRIKSLERLLARMPPQASERTLRDEIRAMSDEELNAELWARLEEMGGMEYLLREAAKAPHAPRYRPGMDLSVLTFPELAATCVSSMTTPGERPLSIEDEEDE